MCVCTFAQSCLFATPWTVAHQAPLSLGFSRQEILEQGAITYSMGSSWPGDQTDISCVSWSGRQILYHCATWAAFCYLYVKKKGWRGPEGEEGHSLQLWYLRLLIFLLTILIPACASSSPTFYMMYSAGWQYTALMYSFPDLEPVCGSMSGSNFASWPAYRFLRI